MKELEDIYAVQNRLLSRFEDCIRRFAKAEDLELSDRELVLTVFKRWFKDQDVFLDDPSDGVFDRGF